MTGKGIELKMKISIVHYADQGLRRTAAVIYVLYQHLFQGIDNLIIKMFHRQIVTNLLCCQEVIEWEEKRNKACKETDSISGGQ